MVAKTAASMVYSLAESLVAQKDIQGVEKTVLMTVELLAAKKVMRKVYMMAGRKVDMTD